jgi:hypothetical protein
VQITVEEAYIHCSKHIPLLKPLNKKLHWGTDNLKFNRGDYFHVRSERIQAVAQPNAKPDPTSERTLGRVAIEANTTESAQH